MKISLVKKIAEVLFSSAGAVTFLQLGFHEEINIFFFIVLALFGYWMFDIAYWFKYEYKK